jgi:peptide-methionine (R)-S-oxide reductase
MREIEKTKEEWQQELTGQQCFVLFEKGNGKAFFPSL